MNENAPAQGAYPSPEFDHRAYGVEVTSFGDEGGYAARGHVGDRRFAAACNHFARTVQGLVNALDDRDSTIGDFTCDIRRVWAVPVDPAAFGCDGWAVSWTGIHGGTPGAIPMTIWEP